MSNNSSTQSENPNLCYHCKNIIPKNSKIELTTNDGKVYKFCCHGCKSVFTILNENGLSSRYYQGQTGITSPAPIPIMAKQNADNFTKYVKEFTTDDNKTLKSIIIYIDGIHCPSCVWLNEKYVSEINGVRSIKLTYSTNKATIEWNDATLHLQTILDAIVSIGYSPKPYSPTSSEELHRKQMQTLLIKFGIAFSLMMQVLMFSIALYYGYYQGMNPIYKVFLQSIIFVLTLPILFYSGYDYIKNGVLNIIKLQFSMDVLIALGTLTSFFYSLYNLITQNGEVYFETTTGIITFFLLGKVIEQYAKNRAFASIHKLAASLPNDARVISSTNSKSNENSVTITELDKVKPGDTILVYPNEFIPLDAVILSGQSNVNEASITGEPYPKYKVVGDSVLSGTLNLTENLTLLVKQDAENSLSAQIIKTIEKTQETYSQSSPIVESVLKIFIPMIIAMSTLTFAYYFLIDLTHKFDAQYAFLTSLAVLLISCPCSLSLASPIAILASSTKALQLNAIISNANKLTALTKLNHIFIDKTGTLTKGEPKIISYDYLYNGNDVSLPNKDKLFYIVSAIEAKSDHILAKAWLNSSIDLYNDNSQIEINEIKTEHGLGIKANYLENEYYIGNIEWLIKNGLTTEHIKEDKTDIEGTVVYVGVKPILQQSQIVTLLAKFMLQDELKSDSKEIVAMLQQKNKVGITIISGDTVENVKPVAKMLGIKDYYGSLTPESKSKLINDYKNEHKSDIIAMIGDGLNDTFALTYADVGIAVTNHTNNIVQTADVSLTSKNLTALIDLINLAKQSNSIVKQNFMLATMYNLVAIPYAMTGNLTPFYSALAMGLSSVVVVLNSLRILLFRSKQP